MAATTKLPEYKMSRWKKHKLEKGARASRTRSSPGKMYIPNPPPGGWPAWSGSYSDYGVRMARK